MYIADNIVKGSNDIIVFPLCTAEGGQRVIKFLSILVFVFVDIELTFSF